MSGQNLAGRLVCLGELLMDMFPAELGRSHAEVSAYRPVPGGAPANVAVAAARLGMPSAFIGKVGEDPFGHHLSEVLAHEGVETRGIRFDSEARTTLNFMAQPDPHHYDCFFYRNPGADTRLRADELDQGLLRAARGLHCGSLSLSAEPIRTATHAAVQMVRESGGFISFDVNYRPTLWEGDAEALARIEEFLPEADLVKVNEAELALLCRVQAIEPEDGGRLGASLIDRGPRVVVVTLGAQGSVIYTASGREYVPAFQVHTADATGCGDAFIAALLVQLIGPGRDADQLDARRLRDVLRFANAAGALTAQRIGVIPALPSSAEIAQFLAKAS